MNLEQMKNIFTACVSIVVTVALLWGAGELYRRWKEPYWTLSMAMKYEPVFFSRHVIKPEKNIYSRRDRPNISYNINALGYRGNGFPVDKTDSELRILIYGGSQVFDIETTGKSWSELIEDKLRGQGYSNVEVINGGIPGHNSAESVGKLFARGHVLEPDFTVLCNEWNDIKYFQEKPFPLMKIKPHNKLRADRRYYQNVIDRFLGEHSQLYTHLRSRYYRFLDNPGVDTSDDNKNDPARFDGELTETAIRQYRLNVRTFIRLSRDIGAEPILIVQPRLPEPDNSQEERKKIHYSKVKMNHETLVRAFENMDRILKNEAQRLDVTIFDAASEFRNSGQLFNDHIHFSPEGSRAMARFMSGKLATILSRPHDRPGRQSMRALPKK